MAQALSMMRTNPGQVIPDTTLNRRLNMPISIGRPVPANVRKAWVEAIEQMKKGQPIEPPVFEGIYSISGPNTVFDHLELDLVHDRGKMRLLYDQPVYSMNLEGGSSKRMRGFAFFTDAAKMGAPSFSLPAGPQREGGTCAAAGFRAGALARPARGKTPGGARRDDAGRLFVCDNCYATTKNYWYTSTSLAQAGRMHWCIQRLKEDMSGALLGGDLIEAIDRTARQSTYHNLSERMGQEFGVWKRGQIVVPGFVKHRGVVDVPVIPTALPPQTGFSNTFDYFAAQGTPEGSVCGFFRIHDSGDLNVGTKIATWVGYLNAWVRVARAFPHVLFWMPVRAYTNRTMKQYLVRAMKDTPNLVLRASALFVDGPAPNIKGLAASAVHKHDPDPEWYLCPVGDSDKSSCTAVGCRVCWMYPDLVPSYREH